MNKITVTLGMGPAADFIARWMHDTAPSVCQVRCTIAYSTIPLISRQVDKDKSQRAMLVHEALIRQ